MIQSKDHKEKPASDAEPVEKGGTEHKHNLVTLQKQVMMLTKQLSSIGLEAVEVCSLEEAREKFNAALQRLLAGDESAEKEMDKWDNAIKMNPEYAKEQEEKARKWDEDNRPKCVAALRLMRGLIPPDVKDVSKKNLVEVKGLPKELAKRIWDKKILWLVRQHPDDIATVHIADLNNKYSNQGLDIVEMRALWQCVPSEFQMDGDGKKAQWRFNFLQKLQELTVKEEQSRLSKNEKRFRSYDKVEGQSFFDPDVAPVKAKIQKSGAFDATEKPANIVSSAGSVKALKNKAGNGTQGDLFLCTTAEDGKQEWKKFFYHLSGRKLRSFETNEDFLAEKEEKNTFIITEECKINEKSQAKKGDNAHPFSIEIDSGKEKMLVSCETFDELKKWTEGLRESVKWAKMGACDQGLVSNPMARIKKNKSKDKSSGEAENPLLAAIAGARGGKKGGGRGGNPMLAAIQNRKKKTDDGGGGNPMLAAIQNRGKKKKDDGGGGNPMLAAIQARGKKKEAGSGNPMLAAIQARGKKKKPSTTEGGGGNPMLAAIQNRGKKTADAGGGNPLMAEMERKLKARRDRSEG